MGMRAELRRLAEEEMKQILTADRSKRQFYFGLMTRNEVVQMGFDPDDEDQISDSIDEFLDFQDNLRTDGMLLNVDNDWQAIHFLVTGEFAFQGKSNAPLPARNVILGGVATPFESTYGFKHVVWSKDVQDVSAYLQSISEDSSNQRLNPEEFNRFQIYPGRTRWTQEDLECVLKVFRKIVNFYQVAATAGECVLISID